MIGKYNVAKHFDLAITDGVCGEVGGVVGECPHCAGQVLPCGSKLLCRLPIGPAAAETAVLVVDNVLQ